jgi:hypothetical protein
VAPSGSGVGECNDDLSSTTVFSKSQPGRLTHSNVCQSTDLQSALHRIRSVKRRNAGKTYADYVRQQPARLSDFERESRAAEALLRDERQKKSAKHRKASAKPPVQS